MSDEYRHDSLALLPDGQLVELAQKGKRAAFESLFHRHQDRIYSVALAIVGNPSDAKDVVQVTFLKAYKRLAKLQKDRAVLSYLCRTASNAAIDVLRSRRGSNLVSLHRADGQPRQVPDSAPGPEEVYARGAVNEALAGALLSLSDDHRVVVVLHHLEGLQVDEIAARLKVPVGTVKSRLGRAREALRRKLIGRAD